MKRVIILGVLFMLSTVSFAQQGKLVREELFKDGSVKMQMIEMDNDLIQATYFHENGLISQRGYLLNENLYGYWESFDVNQDKIASGQFLDNAKIGTWNYWSHGELIGNVSYSNNNVVASEQGLFLLE